MKFNWINVFGAAFVLLLLVPNVVWALRHRGQKNLCENKALNALEQVGRYACIVLMWLPLLVWEFGFKSETAMALYLAGNLLLVAAYLTVFALHMKKETRERALALALLPACVFLLSGITLRHWLLAGFALLFAIAHLYVTVKNLRAPASAPEGESE